MKTRQPVRLKINDLLHTDGFKADLFLAEFAAAVHAGLSSPSKTLPCRYFYDAIGSALFEEICQLPEYYLTRVESSILREKSTEITALPNSKSTVLIELGSGSAEKTRHLIASMVKRQEQLHFIPIDVSREALENSGVALVTEFPTLYVTGYVADYHTALEGIISTIQAPKIVAFLGSSLGNYSDEEAIHLLSSISRLLSPDDRFLLGVDLEKDPRILEEAYNDGAGVTAQFNWNLLARINRELGGEFDQSRFSHVASYNRELRRIEMKLISTVQQHVRVAACKSSYSFHAHEAIHSESSYKYNESRLSSLAASSGFTFEQAWQDNREWYSVQRWSVTHG